jgi:hypothetical protein
MHRLRLMLPDARRVVQANADACTALVEHLDACSDCVSADEFCSIAKPLHDAYRTAKMRSRLYFGEDYDEAADSNPVLPQE